MYTTKGLALVPIHWVINLGDCCNTGKDFSFREALRKSIFKAIVIIILQILINCLLSYYEIDSDLVLNFIPSVLCALFELKIIDELLIWIFSKLFIFIPEYLSNWDILSHPIKFKSENLKNSLYEDDKALMGGDPIEPPQNKFDTLPILYQR